MKLCLVLLCACVAGSLGSVVPLGAGAAGNVVSEGKLASGAVKSGTQLRDWKKEAQASQDWANVDKKDASVSKNWEENSRKAASDADASANDYSKDASKWSQARDAANRAAFKAAANSADKAGNKNWAASNSFDKNQDWAGHSGWKNGNSRREGIKYSFDKNYNRNANDNGGFDAGSSLDDHSLDDTGSRSSSYDRRQNDHSARAANSDAQNADRSAGFNNNAWANRASADKFGHDNRQAANAGANTRDWAEKKNYANGFNSANEDKRSRAADALRDNSQLDRNADRNSVGFGNARDARRGYGRNLGYGAPAAYGYGKVGGAVVGKGFNRAAGGADNSRVWDGAQRNKQQAWDGSNWEDRAKDQASRDQYLEDEVKGYNRDQAASLWDKGFSNDAAQRDEGANANNRQWADANAAKAAQQARHDFDEVAHLSGNQKWNKADRDHKKSEWKKFFSNDKKGGQNVERLKYDRAQTDDSAAADYAQQKDNANRWQDSSRFDSQSQAAKGSDYARANDRSNRYWDQDGSQDANGRQNQAASSSDSANRGVWGSDNDKRKYNLEQAKSDDKNQAQWASDRDAQRRGYDSRAFGNNRGLVRGAAATYPVNGRGYGNFNRGNYGYGYPSNGYGYGGYNSGYGNAYGNAGRGFGRGFGKGYSGF